ASFVLARSIHFIAGYIEDDFFISSGSSVIGLDEFYGPTFLIAISCVHPVKITRKNTGLVSTGSRTNLQNGIFGIGRIFGDKQHFYLLFHRFLLLLQL